MIRNALIKGREGAGQLRCLFVTAHWQGRERKRELSIHTASTESVSPASQQLLWNARTSAIKRPEATEFAVVLFSDSRRGVRSSSSSTTATPAAAPAATATEQQQQQQRNEATSLQLLSAQSEL